MAGKYYNLDLDITLGGETASNTVVPSQKAIKTYIDTGVNALNNNIDNKADKSDTLNGYGIEDCYTKQEVDNKITTVTFRSW